MNIDEENLNELLETYSSESDVQAAMKEKEQNKLQENEPVRIPNREPEDELDLHQQTGKEAENSIEAFIRSSYKNGVKILKIITGKGLHSEGGRSVLRSLTAKKISGLQKEGLVTVWKWESKNETKSGAMIVYLA